MSSYYRWKQRQLTLYLQIQPKASRSGFAEVLALEPVPRLKVRVAAPPVDGKANAELTRFLAKAFKTSRSSIAIAHGESGKLKTVTIDNPGQIPAGLEINKPS